MGDARITPEETGGSFEAHGELGKIPAGEARKARRLDPCRRRSLLWKRGEFRSPSATAKFIGDGDEAIGDPLPTRVARRRVNHDPRRIRVRADRRRLESGVASRCWDAEERLRNLTMERNHAEERASMLRKVIEHQNSLGDLAGLLPNVRRTKVKKYVVTLPAGHRFIATRDRLDPVRRKSGRQRMKHVAVDGHRPSGASEILDDHHRDQRIAETLAHDETELGGRVAQSGPNIHSEIVSNRSAPMLGEGARGVDDTHHSIHPKSNHPPQHLPEAPPWCSGADAGRVRTRNSARNPVRVRPRSG